MFDVNREKQSFGRRSYVHEMKRSILPLFVAFLLLLSPRCLGEDYIGDRRDNEELIVREVTIDVTKLNSIQILPEVLFVRRSTCRKGTGCNLDGYRMEEVSYDVTFPPYAIDGYIARIPEVGHILLRGDNRTRGDVEFIGIF